MRVFDLVGRPLGLYQRQGKQNPLILARAEGGVVDRVEEPSSADARQRQAELLWHLRDQARRASAARRCA